MVLISITGASGIAIAVKILEILESKRVKTELIVSNTAKVIIKTETNYDLSYIRELATYEYDIDDFTAPPASGSHRFQSMIIIPCSMKTLSAIANGYADNLITRAADVAIKEKRRLILAVRESPFNAIHLEHMLKLARLGVIIAPPIPSYYIKPKDIDQLIDQSAGRYLDLLGIETNIKRWGD
ncbi:MAG: Flavin prenyltransferase UbiX [Promethearchaeota archaeon]|nr:MAG: Flavin prenyltransferase UbiX [Candidatus Lokiarchaeota archaeon]